MSEQEIAERIATAGDVDLVLRTRSGDRDAFAELWRRHYRSGLTVARSITSAFDADDLVQEAYARIFQSIRRGGGPTGSFRAYLFTSIRNTAAAWGRARREVGIDELEAVADPRSTPQAAEDSLDRSLTNQAFRSLPSRWQEVLWYTEIEGMKPAEVAPLLGLSAGGVSQLAFRAREGLREAWIQVHLRTVADGSECQYAIERLGAYERNNVGRRDRARIEKHLHRCARCTIVYGEAKEASRRLALVLLPLTVGAGAATAYLASLQGAGAPVAALAAMPSGVVEGGVLAAAPAAPAAAAMGADAAPAAAATTSGSASGGALSAGAVVGVVAGGFAVAAVVAAALVVPGLLGPAPVDTATEAVAPVPAVSEPAVAQDDAATAPVESRADEPLVDDDPGADAEPDAGVDARLEAPPAARGTTPDARTPAPGGSTAAAPPPTATPPPPPAAPPLPPPADTTLRIASVQASVTGPRQVELAVAVNAPAGARVQLDVRGSTASATADADGRATLVLVPPYGQITNGSVATVSAVAPDGAAQTLSVPLADLVDPGLFDLS